MAMKVRAKSTIKLVSDTGMQTTWEIPKGASLKRLICNIMIGAFRSAEEVEEMRSAINKHLDETLSDFGVK